MSKYIIKSPGRYIQESGSISRVWELSKHLGYSQIILSTKSNYNRIKDKLLGGYGITPEVVFVTNDSTLTDICLSVNMLKHEKSVIVGIGGGSVIDLAKHCAYTFNLNCVIIPTVCSSDAACTSMIVPKSYDNRDTMIIRADRGPELVIVDPEVLITSPVNYILAGIGDALSTYYEAEACERVGGITMTHGNTPVGMIQEARGLKDTLLSISYEALSSIKDKKVSTSVETLIYCCIYKSGILSENCGLSIPHAFSLALDEVYPDNGILHGYKVSYGILVQLFIENLVGLRSDKEFHLLNKFYKRIGLPTSLKDLGLGKDFEDRLMEVARSISENKLSKNVTGKSLNVELIHKAITQD